MFKRFLIAASLVVTALSYQTPAQANGGLVIKFGGGHGFHQGINAQHKTHNSRRTFRKRGHYSLSNKQLRHRLKAKGLYNIRFVDRYNGVAKVVAHNHRGYIARYNVSTRNGHILNARVIRNKRRFR